MVQSRDKFEEDVSKNDDDHIDGEALFPLFTLMFAFELKGCSCYHID